MNQYVINVEDGKQADALIQYLRALDFVEITPLKQDGKVWAATDAKALLKGLPNQSAKQSDVNQAVKSIRKKRGSDAPPPDGKPKVELGAGRHLAYMSDTLFDDDLYK